MALSNAQKATNLKARISVANKNVKAQQKPAVKIPVPLAKAPSTVPVGTSIPVSKLQLYSDKNGNKWFEDSQGNKIQAKQGTPLLQVKENRNTPVAPGATSSQTFNQPVRISV